MASFYHVGFPDPFAVATVGGEQTHTTSVIKKTLNPYWNEIFDLYAVPCSLIIRLGVNVVANDTCPQLQEGQ